MNSEIIKMQAIKVEICRELGTGFVGLYSW